MTLYSITIAAKRRKQMRMRKIQRVMAARGYNEFLKSAGLRQACERRTRSLDAETAGTGCRSRSEIKRSIESKDDRIPHQSAHDVLHLQQKSIHSAVLLNARAMLASLQVKPLED